MISKCSLFCFRKKKQSLLSIDRKDPIDSNEVTYILLQTKATHLKIKWVAGLANKF